ncbi:MAG: amidohydrolase family protein [Parvibaculum sp.]
MRFWLLILVSFLLSTPTWSGSYDLIIKNGRVIDTETGLDRITDVAISNGRIEAIGDNLTDAPQLIDASGLVVAPGFIDLHSHAVFSDAGQFFHLSDGVTSALELEAGAHPVGDPLSRFPNGSFINYGSAAGYLNARLAVKDGIYRAHSGDKGLALANVFGVYGATRAALGYPLHAMFEESSDADIDATLLAIKQDLDDGAIGIALLADYMSEGLSTHELRRIFEFAADNKQIIITHMRRPARRGDPAGLNEMLQMAEETGAALHICHINSNALNAIDTFLGMIRDARSKGVDVSTEAYPYTASSTLIGANAFSRDWRRMYGTDYSDIEDPETGQRLTEQSFNELRTSEPNHAIIQHVSKPEWLNPAIAEPDVIIASDAMPKPTMDFRVHPRGIGTFSRVVGPMVREGVLTLNDAIAKMTLLPAQRLERMAPSFAHKGRLQPGMDADITIFDATTVTDRATYADPNQTSEGIIHVIIAGQIALTDSKVVDTVRAGGALRAPGK